VTATVAGVTNITELTQINFEVLLVDFSQKALRTWYGTVNLEARSTPNILVVGLDHESSCFRSATEFWDSINPDTVLSKIPALGTEMQSDETWVKSLISTKAVAALNSAVTNVLKKAAGM